jgi:hypothetical protein
MLDINIFKIKKVRTIGGFMASGINVLLFV